MDCATFNLILKDSRALYRNEYQINFFIVMSMSKAWEEIWCSYVLRDPEWHPVNRKTVIEESESETEVKPDEDDVTRETFSPTVLEYMMRNMTLESCNTDVMLCLKGVEPILHQYKPMLIEKTQLPSLFASTLTHKSLLPLRNRLLDYQSGSCSYIIICRTTGS